MRMMMMVEAMTHAMVIGMSVIGGLQMTMMDASSFLALDAKGGGVI